MLTNGRYWQFYAVSNGKAELQRTIDIGEGDSRFVARDLDKAIGRHVINNVPERAALRHVSSNAESPGNVVQQSRREAIVENLRQYRERKRKQRRQPAFTIFNDEAIELNCHNSANRLATTRQYSGNRAFNPATPRGRYHQNRPRRRIGFLKAGTVFQAPPRIRTRRK